ncbi:hypothetical protein J7U46_09650 [Pelomonas sp. V22]|uniref:hypothetical protein n=1 Tax=Pelomonas sp. V22 TaxID=2822139 RepID=UPI0024A91230|nr:hypothetical protein [Pelomonas sp. V22]MDI4633310.1 hypothetical protein [Pelomonas sp. V22]
MNCKPGDLAVVVRGYPAKNVGKVVRVSRINPLVSKQYGEPIWDSDDDSWMWPDSTLLPIRDNDGEDETLTWAGKPEAVPA